MAKRLFVVLSMFFVFSFLFVQVSEAGDPIPAGSYTFTITKIGFYITDPGDNELPPDVIIDLPSSQICNFQVGGSTPSINDFVYQGNIPNGTFEAISVYVESSTVPNFDLGWFTEPFDNGQIAVAKTFNEADRKLIKFNMMSEYQYATVENL